MYKIFKRKLQKSYGWNERIKWVERYFKCTGGGDLVAESCPTLWDPVDGSPPGSTVHGILQARILEWVTISSSRGSSQPRDQTQVSCIAGRLFTIWASREALWGEHYPKNFWEWCGKKSHPFIPINNISTVETKPILHEKHQHFCVKQHKV